mmetsp:Transcript_26184/g.73404  ORF Transcript_26184/g.73404 Transcript_26184/m.73404 type:complete len:318 (-) Transcript_26184:236-1189(-)
MKHHQSFLVGCICPLLRCIYECRDPQVTGSFHECRRATEEAVTVRDEYPVPTVGQLPPPAMAGLESGIPSSVDQLPWSALPPGLEKSPSDTNSTAHSGPEGLGALFRGGETAGLERVQYFFWETDLVASYFEIRNGLLGRDYSTKLSPWLAHGCVSPRRVAHELRRYEADRVANKSTYWITFELLTRDFYKFFAAKHGKRIFLERGLEPGIKIEWDPRLELLERWKAGKTGMPLVDACMKELNQTGYMSNRGRQNVASFLVIEYGVDWRQGAAFFEQQLIDHDAALNWGNWVAAAGLTGTPCMCKRKAGVWFYVRVR